jgi:hypothetical protein
MLQLLYEEVIENFDAKDDYTHKREDLLNILYPNSKGKSAFDLAVKSESPKIIEIFLNVLIQLESV